MAKKSRARNWFGEYVVDAWRSWMTPNWYQYNTAFPKERQNSQNRTVITWYGNTSCGDVKGGIQNQKGFWLTINICTQRKSLNFENWSSGGHHFRKWIDLKIDAIKMSTKCAPKFVFFNENKIPKIPMIFDIENWL